MHGFSVPALLNADISPYMEPGPDAGLGKSAKSAKDELHTFLINLKLYK